MSHIDYRLDPKLLSDRIDTFVNMTDLAFRTEMYWALGLPTLTCHAYTTPPPNGLLIEKPTVGPVMDSFLDLG